MQGLLWKEIFKILTSALARKLEIFLAAAGISTLSVAVKARHYLAQFVPQPSEEWAIVSIGVALTSILIAIAVFFWFLPKFKPTDFGTHINIKTGKQFCSTCLLQDKIHSPMFLDHDKSYWLCSVNKSHRRDNPDYVAPAKNENPSYPAGFPGY